MDAPPWRLKGKPKVTPMPFWGVRFPKKGARPVGAGFEKVKVAMMSERNPTSFHSGFCRCFYDRASKYVRLLLAHFFYTSGSELIHLSEPNWGWSKSLWLFIHAGDSWSLWVWHWRPCWCAALTCSKHSNSRQTGPIDCNDAAGRK